MNNDIKIFAIHKNEYHIEDWLIYHGDLFGFENIYLVDNNSNSNIKKILHKYEKEYNINLYNVESYKRERLKTINGLINETKDKVKFVLPIDADEFISCIDNNKLIFDGEYIKNYIYSLDDDYKYMYNVYYNLPLKREYIDPLTEINKFKKQGGYTKMFFPTKHFISTDMGNHKGKININDDNPLKSNLLLIHFRNAGYKALKDRVLKYCLSNTNGDLSKVKTKVRLHISEIYEQIENNTYDLWYDEQIKKNERMNKNILYLNSFNDEIKKLRLKYK